MGCLLVFILTGSFSALASIIGFCVCPCQWVPVLRLCTRQLSRSCDATAGTKPAAQPSAEPSAQPSAQPSRSGHCLSVALRRAILCRLCGGRPAALAGLVHTWPIPMPGEGGVSGGYQNECRRCGPSLTKVFASVARFGFVACGETHRRDAVQSIRCVAAA